jgi:uncharacterized protein (UPF0264 family)
MKLLVSVVNIDEAIEALVGGADIIDVKNPSEGALGANFPWVISEIRAKIPLKIEISATLGDLHNLPGTVSLAAYGASLSGADYLKVGLFDFKFEEEIICLIKNVKKSIKKIERQIKIIAAGYADYREFGGFDPLKIPKIAYKSEVNGVMIDIKTKNSKNLFDFFTDHELTRFINDSHHCGLMAALAGSLGEKEIPRIRALNADIFGVRRSVCSNEISGPSRVKNILVKRMMDKIKT